MRARFEREHAPAFADGAIEAGFEVARARADIGDRHAGGELDERDDVVGALPPVALGRVEHAREALDVREVVVAGRVVAVVAVAVLVASTGASAVPVVLVRLAASRLARRGRLARGSATASQGGECAER
jgi:hypothetical protein